MVLGKTGLYKIAAKHMRRFLKATMQLASSVKQISCLKSIWSAFWTPKNKLMKFLLLRFAFPISVSSDRRISELGILSVRSYLCTLHKDSFVPKVNLLYHLNQSWVFPLSQTILSQGDTNWIHTGAVCIYKQNWTLLDNRWGICIVLWFKLSICKVDENPSAMGASKYYHSFYQDKVMSAIFSTGAPVLKICRQLFGHSFLLSSDITGLTSWTLLRQP